MNAATLPSPFRASVIREFRQHGLWAGAAAVALSGALAFLLYASRWSGQSMASDVFMSGTLSLFFALGLAIGLSVMLGSLLRGQWGFLVNRPLSRRRLFAAKFVAAAAMYGIATTLAITVAAIFAHSPRYVRAPFSMTMLLPVIYFQLCGLAWLACALLVAVRRASWVGTRLYPLAIPALTLTLVYAGKLGFITAAGVVLLLTAGLFACGANYFAANGNYEPQPSRAKPLAFLAVFAGVLVLLTTGVAQIDGAARDVFGADAPRLISDTSYGLTGTGKPWQHVQYNNGTWQDSNLDGRRIADATSDVDGSLTRYGGVADLFANNPYDTDRARARAAQKSFLAQENGQRGMFDRRGMATYTFVARRRTVEAYDYDDNYLGGVGPSGFYDARAAQEPFPATSRLRSRGVSIGVPLLIVSNDTVWRIDLRRRTVEIVFRTDADGPVLDTEECYPGEDARFVCVLTPRHVYAVPVSHDVQLPESQGVSTPMSRMQLPPMAQTPGPTRSLALPEAKPAGRVSVAVFGDDGLAALTDPTPGDGMHPLITRTLSGKLTLRPLPPLPIPVTTPAMTDRSPVALTLPPVLVPLTKWSRSATAWAWLLPVAPLIAVGWTLLLARRREWDRRTTGVWIGLSILLGLHTPLTLIFLLERPARVRCPACGKWRTVDHETCRHCGKPFPTPGDPATNVFAPAGRTAA